MRYKISATIGRFQFFCFVFDNNMFKAKKTDLIVINLYVGLSSSYLFDRVSPLLEGWHVYGPRGRLL